MFLMENQCFPKVFHTFWRVSEDRCRLGEIPLPLEKYEIPYAKHYFSIKTPKLLRKTEVSTFSGRHGRPGQGSQTSKTYVFLRNLKVLIGKVQFYLRNSILLGVAKKALRTDGSRLIP